MPTELVNSTNSIVLVYFSHLSIIPVPVACPTNRAPVLNMPGLLRSTSCVHIQGRTVDPMPTNWAEA